MITSLALLAALTISADGDSSAHYSSRRVHSPSQAPASGAERPEIPPRVIVVPLSGPEDSDRTAVDLISNVENGGPIPGSMLPVEEIGASEFEVCDSCCDVTVHGHLGFPHRFYPSPYCSPGNMPQHFPYSAAPKNYYYFRPYNWFHILEQQKEVVLYGGDPRHPYANDLFQEIYQEIEAKSGLSQVGN